MLMPPMLIRHAQHFYDGAAACHAVTAPLIFAAAAVALLRHAIVMPLLPFYRCHA